MPEIKLVKRYPHIKDEDVTSIFQEGYTKGFENGRKDAIPIEFIEEYIEYQDTEEKKVLRMMWHAWELWEKENETN